MKLAHRTKWVEALRSGEYPQGRGFLKVKRADGKCYYCCIGVLCEVIKDDLPTRLLPEEPIGDTTIYHVNGRSGYLDRTSGKEVGLSSDQQSQLGDLNDFYGKTFLEIADWIEENIEATPEEEAGTSETV